MEDHKKMTELRAKIDAIDAQLVALINKRAQTALQVRIAKGGQNIYRPQREVAVLEHVTSLNKGPLSAEALNTLFQSIIYVCRSIQEVDVKTK